MLQRIYRLGFIVYGVLFALSIVFAKERIIFIDMASNLFYMLVRQQFIISHFRFADCVSQAFPLIAIKAGLPLITVVQFYSAGYILFSLGGYVFCGGYLKRYDYALVILLQNVLFATDTFYVLSQLHQAIILIVVLFAVIGGRPIRQLSPREKMFGAFLLITILFFHPAAMFVIFFVLGYFFISNADASVRKSLVGLGVTAVVVLVFKLVLFHSTYESHSMSGMKNFVRLFPHYFDIYSNRHFLRNCVVKYYWVPILSLVIVFYYVRRKLYLQVLLYLLTVAGYLFFVNVCYPDNVTPDFYVENIYLPIGIFIALPFVFEVAPALRGRYLLALIGAICLSGLGRICYSHSLYTNRLENYRNIIAAYGKRKMVLNEAYCNPQLIMKTWGAPYELMLLSECELAQPASIIIDSQPRNYMWCCPLRDTLVVNWYMFGYHELPAKYMKITDTLHGYELDTR